MDYQSEKARQDSSKIYLQYHFAPGNLRRSIGTGDAVDEHALEPLEAELVHDVHLGKISQHEIEHSATNSNLFNDLIHTWQPAT